MTTSLQRHPFVLGVLASAAISIAAAPAVPASAASHPQTGFFIQPAGHGRTFEFPARPGAHVRGNIRVVNDSRKAKTIRLAAADVGTFPSGGVMYRETAPRDAGRWIHLDTRQVSVPPHSAATVGFVARVPSGVAGGFHYAGVVASEKAAAASPRQKPKDGRRQVRVRQVVRFALPVRLRLPGPLSTRLAVSGVGTQVDAVGLSLVLRLKNAGNTLIRETAVDLTVSGAGGPVLRHRGALGPFAPDSAIANAIRWRKPPAEGEYRVVGTLRPAGGPTVRIDRTFTFSKRSGRALEEATGQEPAPSTSTPIVMWIVAGLACAIAIAALAGYWRMRRRVRAPAGA